MFYWAGYLNSIKVSLFYFSPEIFKLTRRGVLSIRNIAWCSFKFPSRMLPSAVTAFLIVRMSPQALSVISEVGDLLQLKYSRHKIQPARPAARDAYEDVDD